MKKTSYILIVAAFLITTVGPSCKKNTETKSTSIQYKITPFDNYIVLLRYNDNTGNQVTIPNPSLALNDNNNFINGSKTFSVSTKPYSAKVEITVLNSTTALLTYNLTILVNGTVEKTVAVSAPVSQNLYTASAEFTVQ